MQPDGAATHLETKGDVHEKIQTSRNEDPDITAREAFRSPIFWNLICSMTARSLAFTTVTTHFIPMMVWKGLTQTEASVLLAGFAIFNLPIHFLLGWIADFVNKPKLVTTCLLLGVIAVLPMLWANALWALWFFAALYTVLDASIPVFLGIGRRLLQSQVFRCDPRQHEPFLHLGRHPWPLRRRRHLRPHPELRAGVLGDDDRFAHRRRAERLTNQTMGRDAAIDERSRLVKLSGRMVKGLLTVGALPAVRGDHLQHGIVRLSFGELACPVIGIGTARMSD
jgi:hypothetical protein